ncbi:hypothetical protein HIM_08784 [Hirsutella minnesotensis 3608]|uniref:AB hydrolase-1 domain-containing protein n=1 Tax=Hirsutella minnesotensis 3608 TaxID=1043627 RepID=A0A0F7ZSR3_9HYPO|nr:hypothetical protein HIM_08784 [Hirsutella minnesotensis 3608]
MDTSKLVPNDPRVRHGSSTVRGKTYQYIIGEPEVNTHLATVFLIHGFPDLGFGWRYQVPYLMSLGFRVVVPDMLGYAGTDRPQDLRDFSLKNISSDIKELARRFVGNGQIILGGHDWGGALVWRTALWHPELIKAVFSICTPFLPPRKNFIPLEDAIAAGNLTNFRYQLQFRGPNVENAIQGEDKIRQFLNVLQDEFGIDGETGFSVNKGVIFENLPKQRKSERLSDAELEFYVQQYMLQDAPQLRGGLNWYRTSKINWEEELPLADNNKTILSMPTLFIAATNDSPLPPSMSIGMEQYMLNLTRGKVESSHWAQREASADVNELLGKWLDCVLNRSVPSSP